MMREDAAAQAAQEGVRGPVVVQHVSVPVAPGGVVATTTLSAETGCPELVQQIVALGAGGDWQATVVGGGQCWYVAEGRVSVYGDARFPVESGMGVFIPPGGRYRIVNEGTTSAQVVAVSLPAPAAGDQPVVAALEDCPVERTGDREFRVLLGPHCGVRTATQFVGDIPPGRAPEHAHPYDEVVRVLHGEGRVHAGGEVHALRAGTCVYLPPHVPHCLENASLGPMRVLGVFHPGESPAAKVPLPAATASP